jgi:glycosyltransferase involved in cell wall biosynthesis
VIAPRVLHVTTTDISLALLLGPQLIAFAEAGYDVVGASAPGPFVDDLVSMGIRHVPLRHATRSISPLDDALAPAELYRLCRLLRPDVVHTHNPKPGIYGRLAARAARVPAVVNTVHGLYATPDDPWRRRAAVYGVERLAAACSHAELVQNSEDLETLARLGVPRGRLHLLGNGIDLCRFSPGPASAGARTRIRAELGIDDNTVVIGAVGRLVWEKGYAEVFAAARHLAQSALLACVVVVGPADPSKPDGLGPAELARAEADGVRLLGFRADVEDIYAGRGICSRSLSGVAARGLLGSPAPSDSRSRYGWHRRRGRRARPRRGADRSDSGQSGAQQA